MTTYTVYRIDHSGRMTTPALHQGRDRDAAIAAAEGFGNCAVHRSADGRYYHFGARSFQRQMTWCGIQGYRSTIDAQSE